MRLIGMITFLDSLCEGRSTAVMDFRIASDWFQSVREYFQQEVMTGRYDGSEIMISVFEYKGSEGIFGRPENFEFDSDNLVQSLSIMNPYYV